MALTREQVIDTAFGILRDYGIADLSMRRLARDLNVQPGALYWHVKNKQDLLGVLAVMILKPVKQPAVDGGPATPPAAIASLRLHCRQIRQALLAVRDGAEVVALTHTLDPLALPSLQGLTETFAAAGVTGTRAAWAGRALVHYILGTVTQEQTRSGLAQAGLLAEAPGPLDETEAFNFGLELLLSGSTELLHNDGGQQSRGVD
ncbi:TetR/AcrR family transcriptional regulator C-terminal domain-containing protein [Arthrobacter sp. H35-D1]|uniref:TetR/AcrR family transcriptional regulator C-terminal domain-containing protein n=1 Tax=Arthrobacter sp. H35-D1 TaxID=3046202 RepID=UPI0024BBAA75|nr:TetR/AcrR family transcriptional regulator C-terminal domain-containing protein [Arthrobacter sp. H35-D1]MDJ0314834.1 TetR/AcrR family transcriptional regulator C-terminal domain-containing protein [Arthrobacter sp. H35-D1]